MVMGPGTGTPGQVAHLEVVLVNHIRRLASVRAHNQSCHEPILKARASALVCLHSLVFSAQLFFGLLNPELHMLGTAF